MSVFPSTFFRTPEVAEIYRGRGLYQHDAPRHEDEEYVRSTRGKPGQSRVGSVQLRRRSARGGDGESGVRRVALLAVSRGEGVDGFIALGKPRQRFPSIATRILTSFLGLSISYSDASCADFIGNPFMYWSNENTDIATIHILTPLTVADYSRGLMTTNNVSSCSSRSGLL